MYPVITKWPLSWLLVGKFLWASRYSKAWGREVRGLMDQFREGMKDIVQESVNMVMEDMVGVCKGKHPYEN